MEGQKALSVPLLCAEYLQLAGEALTRKPFVPPDISKLAGLQLPDSGIKNARHTGKDYFELGWPFVALQMDDYRGERTERYVDQWYFVPMQLFAFAGCHLGLMPSKTKIGEPPRWYLAYGKKEHQLRRMIANTPAGSDTRQNHPTVERLLNGRSDAHYDYRRATLMWKSKTAVRAAGQLTRRKSRGREEAIAFAVERFKQKSEDTRLSDLQKSDVFRPRDFEKLLRETLSIADKMHEAFARTCTGGTGNGNGPLP